jgi:uncharacterized SAM-binding protein YcdF (DUF218 family)
MQSENLPEAGPGTNPSCMKFFGGCTGLTLAGMVSLALVYVLLVAIGHYLVVSDPLHDAKAIVVLSGDSGGRMVETASLFKEHLADWVILTETDQPSNNGEIETPSTQAKRLDALNEGIPGDSILFTSVQSTSTVDEAKAVLSLMHDKDLTSCIVVTDPFHSRRTRKIFNDVFKGSGITVMVHPVSGHWYHASTWFLSRLGWNTTILEYSKYIGYLLGIRRD